MKKQSIRLPVQKYFGIAPVKREIIPATIKQREARKKPRMSPTKQKILLLLLGGLSLGLAGSPRQYFRAVEAIQKEWKAIDRRALNNAIRSLYKSKLVDVKNNKVGLMTMVLSEEGKQIALTYDLSKMEIGKPKRWDGKWRILTFDVPEKLKETRESLRMHFKQMEFYEFQKSVFVHPFPCREEFEYIVEFYNARRYLRFILATEIDNELELKKHFELLEE